MVEDAVTRQLVSDVPLCTFLSGGVDSSAITAIAANAYRNEGKGQLHTYSIDYEDNAKYFKANDFQPNADGPWIEKMTQEFQTVHHSSIITQELLTDYLTEAVHVRDFQVWLMSILHYYGFVRKLSRTLSLVYLENVRMKYLVDILGFTVKMI